MLLTLIIIAIVGFAVALVLSRLAIAAGLWDNPDATRKAHRKATPTSGGLAISAGAAAALLAAASPALSGWAEAYAPQSLARLLGVAVLAFFAAALGFVDDARPLGPKIKAAVMAAAALAFTALAARADRLPLTADIAVSFPWIIAVLGSALLVFTLMNAVNFMDGANGISMGSAAISLIGLGAIGLAQGAGFVAVAAFAGAFALAGFLVWNFPNGALFAGDSGSLFAGGLGAGLSLLLVQEAAISPLIPLLLFFPTLADVLLTLLWRAKAGRSLLYSHRDHLYQVGLRAGLTHKRVALIYWGATAHCVLIAFLAAYGARIAFAPALQITQGASFGMALGLRAAALFAALSPLLALAALGLVAWRISTRVRAYAAAHGLDGA